MRRPSSPLTLVATLIAGASLALPAARLVTAAPVDPAADPFDAVAEATVTVLPWSAQPALLWLAGAALLALVAALLLRRGWAVEAAALAVAVLAGLAPPVLALREGLEIGPGAWSLAAAALLGLWRLMILFSARDGPPRRLLVPLLFGVAILYGWEVLVRGFAVPLILLPPPSLIATTLVAQAAVLEGDFVQTVGRAALTGYLIGCAAGFALAILCDRFAWLGRGLLPYGNLLSAVPMVGIAPIMIMWFGFGWPSKAAVVVVTTVFPMLINTLAGLKQSEAIERDLMRSYAAGYVRTLVSLRLPHALPFIFTALKINATFALIGAIVAEFFGTPIAGMGFRISTEVARMNLGMVWATIAVAALTGSLSTGALALLERATTSWHPSYRQP